MNRRLFLKSATAATQLTVALALGLLRPVRVLAEWPADGFHATTLGDAITGMTGGAPTTPSAAVEIEANNIAENGASVPVGVRSRLAGTRSIVILSENNPNPAVARFTLNPRMEPSVNTRIKMGATGDVVALVQADGGFYTARKRIQVTAGGCG